MPLSPTQFNLELSCILHVSTDYPLMGSEPSKEEVKNDLLSIISELSTIAKKISSCSAFGNDKIEILLARFDVISNEATEIFLCQVRKKIENLQAVHRRTTTRERLACKLNS